MQFAVNVLVRVQEAAFAHALFTLSVKAQAPPRMSVASAVSPTVLAQVQASHIMFQQRKQSGPDPGHSHGSVLPRAAPVGDVEDCAWRSDE